MTDMTKRQAHFQAFGYEPRHMKPAHFASGFFIALTGRVYANEVLNKVAVIRATKGLQEGYTAEDVFARLRNDGVIAESVAQADVELLRVQANGVVNNDDAMFPAFRPYRPPGNDYTFLSPRMLTDSARTDGFAGFFVFTVLDETESGKAVLDAGRTLADEPPGTLEQLVEPLLADDEPLVRELRENYESDFGVLDPARVAAIAADMETETEAIERLCANMQDYSHYKKIRFYILGLLAWLMSYMLKTASNRPSAKPLLFFDFTGRKEGRIRSQSQACYARLRETVRRSYRELAACDRFDSDPIAMGVFSPKKRPDEVDFKFLEEHFNDLALRMGYIQPRASQVPLKHFELQPDTLRVLMLSVPGIETGNAIPLNDVCERLGETWNVVVGTLRRDLEALREQDYFGFDEEDLRHNTAAFAHRLKSLNMAFEPSDGLVLCSADIGEVL